MVGFRMPFRITSLLFLALSCTILIVGIRADGGCEEPLHGRVSSVVKGTRQDSTNPEVKAFMRGPWPALQSQLVKTVQAIPDFAKFHAGHSAQFIQQQFFLTSLLRNLPGPNTVCETGFNVGHSSLLWMASDPNATLYSFDLGQWIYSNTAREFVKKYAQGRATVTFGDSTKTVPAFAEAHPEVSCNLIFVDGGHTKEIAFEDIKNFEAMANENFNVLVVDDTPCLHHSCEGVNFAWKKAVKMGMIRPLFTYTRDTAKAYAVGYYLKPKRRGLQSHCSSAQNAP